MERRSSKDVLLDLLNLAGAEVIDIGCGGGWLARLMAQHGAHVVGIEVSPKQLALARSQTPVADEHYIQGIAEDLPFAGGSIDIAVFYNSLHHIDAQGLPVALRETARVLKSGGVLYISEPMPEGPYFELMKPVHDETVVRQQAQQALRHAPEYGLLLERALTHVDVVKFKSFEAFHDRLTMINPEIRARFDELEPDLRQHFEDVSTKVDDLWCIDQPMRVTLLRRF